LRCLPNRGNSIIDWQPYRALSDLFDTKQKMEKTLDEIGFFAWNFEQDKGRSWEDGIKSAEATMPEHAEIFRSYRRGLAQAHSDLIPGTSELIAELHQSGVNLFGITNAARESFEAVKSAAPSVSLLSDVVVSADHWVCLLSRICSTGVSKPTSSYS
jgi:2-haloacid dehalogenase